MRIYVPRFTMLFSKLKWSVKRQLPSLLMLEYIGGWLASWEVHSWSSTEACCCLSLLSSRNWRSKRRSRALQSAPVHQGWDVHGDWRQAGGQWECSGWYSSYSKEALWPTGAQPQSSLNVSRGAGRPSLSKVWHRGLDARQAGWLLGGDLLLQQLHRLPSAEARSYFLDQPKLLPHGQRDCVRGAAYDHCHLWAVPAGKWERWGSRGAEAIFGRERTFGATTEEKSTKSIVDARGQLFAGTRVNFTIHTQFAISDTCSKLKMPKVRRQNKKPPPEGWE